MPKMPAGTKGWIVKLYKGGTDIDGIMLKVKGNFPKITKTRIRSVLRGHLEEAADDLWAVAVKVRFGWKCAVSNRTENLEAHHLIRRGNFTHRYSVMNGVSLNSYFHSLGAVIAAHGATDVTERFRAFMKERHWEQWAWFEQHKEDPSRKPELDELLKIIKELEGAIKNGPKNNNKNIGKREPVDTTAV